MGDLAPLAKLVSLEELDLSRTAVTNLAPLKALPKLRHLAVDGLGLRGFHTEGRQAVVLEDPPALSGAGYKPGETFRDCPECPQMVVVPAGGFVMGSPQT